MLPPALVLSDGLTPVSGQRESARKIFHHSQGFLVSHSLRLSNTQQNAFACWHGI
jgi:hypothetical protein